MEGPPVTTALVLYTDVTPFCDAMYLPHSPRVLQQGVGMLPYIFIFI